MRTEILTLEPDCYGLGDGQLIDRYECADPQTDNADMSWLDPYIGKECTIDDKGNVYGFDGKYIGAEYV